MKRRGSHCLPSSIPLPQWRNEYARARPSLGQPVAVRQAFGRASAALRPAVRRPFGVLLCADDLPGWVRRCSVGVWRRRGERAENARRTRGERAANAQQRRAAPFVPNTFWVHLFPFAWRTAGRPRTAACSGQPNGVARASARAAAGVLSRRVLHFYSQGWLFWLYRRLEM